MAKKNNSLLFIGALGYSEIPQDGDTIKNQFLVDYFRHYLHRVTYVDTKLWRKDPFVLVRLFSRLIFGEENNIVVSVSNPSAYRIFKITSKLHLKKKIYYWMIGGYTPIKIKEGLYSVKPFKHLENIIVEADRVSEFYNEVGLNKTKRVYNFKPFSYIPDGDNRNKKKVRFFFLSRLDELKGCDHILECAKRLNAEGYGAKFDIDFYGRIAIDEVQFYEEISKLENVQYKGFLNLKVESNYEVLSRYDAMLFPTRHKTEGFPGAIIDSMIAGVPLIAYRWNYADELIGNGECGILIETGDMEGLYNSMKHVIENRETFAAMRPNCLKRAQEYKMENVLTEELLYELGILIK